jgi:hypothetical protein
MSQVAHLGQVRLTSKAALRTFRHGRGIQYVEHTEGDGVEMFKAICTLGLEGIVSKKLNAPYKSGPSKAWLKIKNPNAAAATRTDESCDKNPASNLKGTCNRWRGASGRESRIERPSHEQLC